jgi:hypothetical protein
VSANRSSWSSKSSLLPNPHRNTRLRVIATDRIGLREVSVTGGSSTNRVTLAAWPTELVLSASDPDGKAVAWPGSYSAAWIPGGRPSAADTLINPIDLGTVLVPNDWLLLGASRASVGIAAICRTNHIWKPGQGLV